MISAKLNYLVLNFLFNFRHSAKTLNGISFCMFSPHCLLISLFCFCSDEILYIFLQKPKLLFIKITLVFVGKKCTAMLHKLFYFFIKNFCILYFLTMEKLVRLLFLFMKKLK